VASDALGRHIGTSSTVWVRPDSTACHLLRTSCSQEAVAGFQLYSGSFWGCWIRQHKSRPVDLLGRCVSLSTSCLVSRGRICPGRVPHPGVAAGLLLCRACEKLACLLGGYLTKQYRTLPEISGEPALRTSPGAVGMEPCVIQRSGHNIDAVEWSPTRCNGTNHCAGIFSDCWPSPLVLDEVQKAQQQGQEEQRRALEGETDGKSFVGVRGKRASKRSSVGQVQPQFHRVKS
jgi:hypothetical protein